MPAGRPRKLPPLPDAGQRTLAWSLSSKAPTQARPAPSSVVSSSSTMVDLSSGMASPQSAWAWTNQQTDSSSSVGPSASQTAPTPTADVVTLQHQMLRYEAIILTEIKDWLSHVIDKVALDTSVQGSGVRASRMKWNRKRKSTIVNSYVKVATEFPYESQKRVIQRIKEQVNDNAKQLDSRAVRRWLAHGPSKKRGRKCNAEFELQILDELVFTSLEKVNGREQAAVIANICYSHDLIILAAKMVQGRPQWKDDPKVGKLKFRRTWIRGWLARNAMRPRRITAQAKQLPPPEKVQEVMLDIQKTIVEGEFTLAEIFNGDESGMFYGAPPKRQYVPLSADRAMAPESDEKSRFTAFLWGSAEGNMQSVFCIVKCSSQNPYDLSRTTVLKNLMRDKFSAENGWELKQWARDMALPAGKKKDEAGEAVLETKKCVRPYLLHQPTGDVITVQNNAWMDSPGIAMWCDLQFGPRTQAMRGKALMVWDNCGPHKVDAVRKVFDEWGVTVKELPPKMTDLLQVMDLVVNGPLKASIRKNRSMELFDFFQDWKIRRLSAAAEKRELPPFSPPKPKLQDGLQATLQCVHTSLEKEKFKQSMRKTFVKVGLAKDEVDTFAVYTAHKKAGWLTKTIFGEVHVNEIRAHMAETAVPVDSLEEAILTLGEVATEFVIEPRDESRMPLPLEVPDDEDEEEESQQACGSED